MSTNDGTVLPKLAAPARRALAGAGYNTLEQLAQTGEGEIAALHGMGPNAMKTLREALQQHGLSFRADG
ncbi:DNA-binding protein [Spirillospora sp. NPDC048823]|uniref:DNA-binding protein n=1 Tax=unclassified Spirillospora TaxID=2642701 RepID=UPI00371FA238